MSFCTKKTILCSTSSLLTGENHSSVARYTLELVKNEWCPVYFQMNNRNIDNTYRKGITDKIVR